MVPGWHDGYERITPSHGGGGGSTMGGGNWFTKLLAGFGGTSKIGEDGPNIMQSLFGGITGSGDTTKGLMGGLGGLAMGGFDIYSGLKQLKLAEKAFDLQKDLAKENLALNKATLRENAESINARRRSQKGGAHQISLPEAGMKESTGIAHFGSAPAKKSAPKTPEQNAQPQLA